MIKITPSVERVLLTLKGLPAHDWIEKKLLPLGAKVWFPFTASFVVEAMVEELEFVLQHNPTGRAVYAYVYATSYELLVEKSGAEWPFELFPEELLSECTITSFSVGIDEPVGHTVELGYEIYKDLGQVMARLLPTRPCRKRVRQAALAAYRKRTRAFISKTHGKSMEAMNWQRLPEKKIYYRKAIKYNDTPTPARLPL